MIEPIKRPRGRPPKVRPEPVAVPVVPEAVVLWSEEAEEHVSESVVNDAFEWDENARRYVEKSALKDGVDALDSIDPTADPVLSPAQIVALDHDHDGQPGGSYPKASLTDQEMIGFLAEFREAYESQTEQKRVDQFNRIWTFGFVIIKNQHTMRIHAKRGPVEAEKLLNSSWMPDDMVREAIEEVSRGTER